MERPALELFVRGLALCLITEGMLLSLRRGAAVYRHLICLLALMILAALPVMQRLIPAMPLLQPAASVRRVQLPPVASFKKSGEPVEYSSSLPEPKAAPESLPTHEFATGHPPTSDASGVTRPSPSFVPTIVLVFWAIGAAVLLIRLIVALVRLSSHRRNAQGAEIDGMPVLLTEKVSTPLTWGVVRPVILIPASLFCAEGSILRSALRHEQAHIQRKDWIWNLVAEAVCILFWFQPGAWWLRARMRLESECACDDLVLLSGVSAPDYADHVVAILRAAVSLEIAPAMGPSGRMDGRIRHILNRGASRRARCSWLLLVTVCGLSLPSLAAIRLASKQTPIEKYSEVPVDSAVPALPDVSGHLDLEGEPTISRHGTAAGLSLRRGLPSNGDNADETTQPAAIYGGRVVWGDTVDGLQPGLLMAVQGRPGGRYVALNTNVKYTVLVRNTTRREQKVVLQCWNTDGIDIPYLIPDGDITAALSASMIPDQFRAEFGTCPMLGLLPAYAVRMAAGETIVVPGTLSLYIGTAGRGGKSPIFPRIEHVKTGLNWIVQPIRIRQISDAALLNAEKIGNTKTTSFDRNGKMHQRSVGTVAAQVSPNQIYAKVQLEVGTPDAEAPRHLSEVLWGKTDKGLQCGIRVVNPRRTLYVGDTLEAEVLWRNVSKKPIEAPMARQPDLFPMMQDAIGQDIAMDRGAQVLIKPAPHLFQPGEACVLGTTVVNLVPAGAAGPNNNEEPAHITLSPGRYRFLASAGVSAVGGGNPISGAFEFAVAKHGAVVSSIGAPKVSHSPGSGLTVWGAEKGGLQLGLRFPANLKTFRSLGETQFEVLLQNVSERAQTCTWLEPSRFDLLSPDIFTGNGKPVEFDHLVAGPYSNRTIQLESGKSIVLGTIRLPDETRNLFDALPSGPYLTSGPRPDVKYRAAFALEVATPGSKPELLTSSIDYSVTYR